MGIDASNAIVDAASLIIDQINRNDDIRRDNVKRGSLVAMYASNVHQQINNSSNNNFCVLVKISHLNCDLKFMMGNRIGGEEIGGYGYDVYAVNNGYIRNKSERGYENWCVIGGRQDDNVIYFGDTPPEGSNIAFRDHEGIYYSNGRDAICHLTPAQYEANGRPEVVWYSYSRLMSMGIRDDGTCR